jgi:hypothetical protein
MLLVRIGRLVALVLLLAAAVWFVVARGVPERGAASATRTVPTESVPVRAAELRARPPPPPPAPAAPGAATPSTPAPRPSAPEAVESGQVLSGIVRDESGVPVDEFVVHWRDGAHFAIEKSRRFTDPLGFFSLDGLATPSVRVHVEGEGYARTEGRLVALPSEEVLEFILLRPAQLTVTVTDARGVRLMGPEVELQQRQEQRLEVQKRQRIPDSGSLTFECRPGEAVLRARAQGHAPSETRVVELRAGEAAEVELALRRPGTITGEVRDAHGNALADLPIRIFPREDGFGEEVCSGLDGLFRFDGLGPNGYTLSTELSDGQKLDQFTWLEEGGEASVTLMTKGDERIHVSGRVMVGSMPLGFGNVFFHGEGQVDSESARIQDDRSFEALLQAPGHYSVHVGCFGDGGFEWTTQVEVPQQAEFEFDLQPPLATVRGSVHDEEGRPVERVPVRGDTAGPRNHSDTRTGPDGRYELFVLAGEFTLQAGGAQNAEWDTEGFAPERIAVLSARAGETIEGLDFQLGRGARLKGRVRFEDGTPAGSAADFVRVLGLVGGDRQFLGPVGEDGRFEFTGVDPAVTRVRVETRTHGSAEVPVVLRADQTSTVELVLEPR